MRVVQLIYASRPFGFHDGALEDILAVARYRNGRDDITGTLICRHDLFMQLLEGPRAKVTATFARILRDDRHVEVALLWCGDAAARLFPDWSMRHDPVRSWMWSRAALAEGAVAGATAEECRQVFVRLSREPVASGRVSEAGRH
ncbi:BLUF domain-containing protein [Falsiroseomonas oryziterrae]|uniref:BLUF domain-containing protein n=1 Tax=Falsiroseomonas oryziterrae TaxID=2911368 RepID=UPI001F3D8705|nr:BLUF domain-containing protein [Roseomonas sp. NPKOSM-4]